MATKKKSPKKATPKKVAKVEVVEEVTPIFPLPFDVPPRTTTPATATAAQIADRPHMCNNQEAGSSRTCKICGR